MAFLNQAILLVLMILVPTSANAAIGDSVEGKFKVFPFRGASIEINGMSHTLIPSKDADHATQILLSELTQRIRYAKAEVTVEIEGTEAPSRFGGTDILVNNIKVDAPWIQPWRPDDLLEAIYWQGALRVIIGGNFLPVISGRGAPASVDHDLKKIEEKVKSATRLGQRVFVKFDGHRGETLARQKVMAVTRIEIANDDEARVVGFEPSRLSSDVQMNIIGCGASLAN